ncbi:MAG: hypothetical protein ACRCZO_00140 [Cetobacterium sp.]
MPFNASLFLLVNIGKASGKISKELKDKNLDIPWEILKDFRNRVLPEIKENFEKIISIELLNKNFSKEEYESCIGNRYYKHVDFKKVNNI